MEYLVPKAPADTVAYFIDWAKQLGDDTISEFALTVSSGAVTIGANPENFGTFIRFLVSGGSDGETAELACTITTALGQSLSRSLQLAILTGAEAVTPQTTTKRQVVEMAFEEIGLAGYEFDATAEEYASALRKLDALMAMWRVSSLDIGYNAPAVIGHSDLSDPCGFTDDAANPVAISLALRIMPAIGKAMSAESRVAYGQAMNALRARYTPKIERTLASGTPWGAGHKPSGAWWPFGYNGTFGRTP